LIVGARVSPAPNDKTELLPNLAAGQRHVTPATVLSDRGFAREAAVTAAEGDATGRPTGLTVLAALRREPHGRAVTQLAKRQIRRLPPEAPLAERMRHRTATAAGRALYQVRQQTVEPALGIIKEVLGFRRFSLRGLAKGGLEWDPVTLAYNGKRLPRLGATLGAA